MHINYICNVFPIFIIILSILYFWGGLLKLREKYLGKKIFALTRETHWSTSMMSRLFSIGSWQPWMLLYQYYNYRLYRVARFGSRKNGRFKENSNFDTKWHRTYSEMICWNTGDLATLNITLSESRNILYFDFNEAFDKVSHILI